jgi:Kef-type K+ transport system membrane component KefB
MDTNSYMIFGPIFFASIGLKTSVDNFSGELLLLSIAFVIVALVTKVIGCGIMSRLLRFNKRDSLKIGVGMMTRGEVALIVSQKGLSAGLLEANLFTPVILLIITSSIITPVILKFLYRFSQEEISAN